MPLWIRYVWSLLIAAQGIMFLVHPIQDYFKTPPETVLLDFGKRPWTAWRVAWELFTTVSLFEMAWMFIENDPWTKSLAYVVFLAGVFVTHVYESRRPLGLLDGGMRVLTKTLWWSSPHCVQWSQVKQYEWADATTLIVNPGWHQITCLIPAEHVESVKAIAAGVSNPNKTEAQYDRPDTGADTNR